MQRSTPRLLAACSMAAALACSPLAFGQDNPAGVQRTPANESPNHGQPMTNDPKMLDNSRTADTAGSMAADKTVNSQLVAFAQNPEATGDACFALKAAAGNMVEIETSKVLVNKATDSKVKDLAQTILDQHQQAQSKLAPIAQKLGVMLPAELPTMHAADVMALKNMSPEMAEKAYLSMMRGDHLKAVNMYTDKLPMLKDADLKAYASETLPHIRMHTAQILSTTDAMGMPLDLTFKDHMSMMK